MDVFSALIESLDQDVGCIPEDLKAQYLQDCVQIMEQMGAVCVPKCSVKQTMLTCVFKKPWTRNINHKTWCDYNIIRNAMHSPTCAYWSHSYGSSFYLEPYVLWPRFALFNPKFLTRNLVFYRFALLSLLFIFHPTSPTFSTQYQALLMRVVHWWKIVRTIIIIVGLPEMNIIIRIILLR